MSVFVAGCQDDTQDSNQDSGQSENPVTANTPPVVELLGESVITIPANTPYVEPGVAATDAEDGDLTKAVRSDIANLNTGVPGQYEITYRVTDSGRLMSTPVKRLVIVTAPNNEQPTATLPPPITDIKLVGYTGHLEFVEIAELRSGSVVDLSLTSVDLLNVVADSADTSKTGSVHFKLNGPVTIDRWENKAVYTMTVDTVNLSIAENQLPVGDYTLSVTPYSLPDMAGQKGSVKTISFKVVNTKTTPSVPKIAAVDLVSVNEGTGDYVPLTRIVENSEIDLSKLSGQLVNIIAVSEDENKTGSVHFSLSGPIDINRAENTANYALQDESKHLNIGKKELPVGDYTLIVTPYAQPNASGEAGVPLMLNFSVVGSVAAPTEPTPPVANNDSYTFFAGSSSQPGKESPVSANDSFESGAKFVITQTPKNGSATMLDLGFFTYTPDAGYAGSDSFSYQITQNGKTSSATVSINVVSQSNGGSTGFTVFKPSADSKLIYVSSSVGSDSNNCLSEAAPCKSISAGLEKMRNGYPDHLYLKRGDVWREERLQNLHSGRSATEPAVITYYGQSGARPKLENTGNSLHIFKGAMKNFAFIGLEFSAYKMDTKNSAFTGTNPADIVMLGGNQNIWFEDNKFHHVEVVVQAWENANPTNITLRRNIWTGAYYTKSSFDRDKRPSNLYAAGVVGLTLEENVFDHGGWHATVPGAAANMYNHNVYIQSSVDGSKLVMRNNIITRGSSHGAQLRSGGIAENNFFARNTVGLLMGYDAQSGHKAYAMRNVITEGGSMVKGDKPCSGANLCTQAVWGLHIEANDVADYQAIGNIVSSKTTVSDDLWTLTFKALNLAGLNGLTDSRIKGSNNIEWNWKSIGTGNYPAPGRTLADYNQSLGGAKSFEAFMDVVLNRPLGQWDEKYTAGAINDYIRAGFGL